MTKTKPAPRPLHTYVITFTNGTQRTVNATHGTDVRSGVAFDTADGTRLVVNLAHVQTIERWPASDTGEKR